MSQTKSKSGKIVVPGERIGVIEEFSPGFGTYTKEGTIYSKITGRTLLDFLDKKVSVYPLVHPALTPRVGNTVIGQVVSAQSKVALIRIFRIGGKLLSGFFTGILHVSDISRSYVESMFDVCKTGDIVRAKVVSDKNRMIHLSTAERNLGVIFAFCSRCGYMLELKRYRLHCLRCGKIEKRKIALDYGKRLV